MIDASTLSFHQFHDSRSENNPDFEGNSGPLVLAIDSDGKKYIVKYTYPHTAANEYTASWLARKISVPTPTAHLLSPTRDHRLYSVAIEFMDLAPFEKKSVPNVEDLIAQFALNALIVQDDIIQLNRVSNRIISYDFAESFCVDNPTMMKLLYSCTRGEDYAVKQAVSCLRNFSRHLSLMDFDIPGLAAEFGLDAVKQKSGMISIAKRVLNITEDELFELEDELEEMYPTEIALYYSECIRIMQKHMKRF